MKDYSFGIIPFFKEGEAIEFLVVKHVAGHWGFPKGHPDKDEIPVEAAKRELKEETGIAECKIIKSPDLESSYSFDNSGESINKTVKYYIGGVKHKKVKILEGEIADYRWSGFDETLDRLSHVGDKELLKKLFQNLDNL